MIARAMNKESAMPATPGREYIHVFHFLRQVKTHKCRIDFQSVLWDIFELITSFQLYYSVIRL
jgi:hypothetical protein